MMKTLSKRLILLLLPVFWMHTVMGQQFSITAGSIDACAGVLEDSGGPSGQYGNNENHTVVICPDNPGDGISLQWLVANLSTDGPNNTADRISIWDGDNTNATHLGDYTGSALQGLIVSATTFNATGCLTVRFVSNGVGVGDFAASITCFTPCERPIAVASMGEPVPARVCQNEVVSFDGSASYAAAGFNIISYTWDFRDGETASGPTATHAFAIPGEYVVQLRLEDDNGCVNSNVVDLQVLVSTTPVFQGTVESHETCIGATVDLSAVVTPVTWTGLPDANFGDGVFLPDDVGQPFTSELNFTQFDPGQTVQSLTDIQSICVEMEHSFMGDLVLQVICPNGQTMIFHQQGGGGTYLGSPNDGDSNANPVLGECWNYCWSPTATNGTWVQNGNGGSTPHTTLAGTPPAQSLNPGTYQPVQPFTNLMGCPLNGAWTYQSTDLWGADNGFICSWSINFNPAIIPEVTQFTPNLGTSTQDSAYWSGPGIVVDPAQPLVAWAAPTVPGDYPYTFSVTDDFGCTYDTTITITVPPLPDLDAGSDIVLCSDPVPMAPSFNGTPPPALCTFVLTLNDNVPDAWNSGANINVTVGGVTTNHTLPCCTGVLAIPLEVVSGTTISLNYHAGTNWNFENSFTLVNDAGTTLFTSPYDPPSGVLYSAPAQCINGTYLAAFEWSPTTGLADPFDAYTTVFVTEPTMFYLSTYPEGHPECAVTDSVLVSPDPAVNPGLSASIMVCAGEPEFLMTDFLGGTPDLDGYWTNSMGDIAVWTFNPQYDTTDTFTYTVTSPVGCTSTSTLAIEVLPMEHANCCGMIDAGEPDISCDLTVALEGIRGNSGVGHWEGPPEAVFADRYATSTTVTMPAGMGGTHTFYWVENDGAYCNQTDSVEKTFTDAYTFSPTVTNTLCFGYCDGSIQMEVTGGNAVASLTYSWSHGMEGSAMDSVGGLCAGTYTLVVTDDNGCSGSMSVVVNEPPLLEIDSLAMLPVTCSGDCDGTVLIHDGEAVEYSFDDGATWTTEAIQGDACEGVWMLRIKDVLGCIGSGSIQVTGPPPVVADFAWGPQPANVDAPGITFANLSTGSDRYFWNVAGLFSTTDVDTYYTFDNKEPGIYEVCLTAWNHNECVDTTCQTVVINDVLFTYIPNAFTPDGDNENDAWWPSANIPVRANYELLVFDRWGQVVFSTTDPYKPWLGSYQNSGNILSSDVYAYRLRYAVDGTDARREVIGHVTLLK